MDDRIDGAPVKLSLRLKRLSRGRVRATVSGPDRALVRRVEFKLGNRRARADARAPFARTISLAGVNRGRVRTIRAVVRLADGTHTTLVNRIRPRHR
jgi:hypothetical protein